MKLRHALFSLAMMISLTQPARAELLMFQGNSLSGRTQFMLQNLDYLHSLPFDGIVLNISPSWDGMLKSKRYTFSDIYDHWLKPLQGKYKKLSGSYILLVTRDSGDILDPWPNVVHNWQLIARSARKAGVRGIWFDNEDYFEETFTFSPRVKYPERGLRAYQEGARAKGRAIMRAVQKEWPDARIMFAHGPYVSAAATPDWLTKEQVGHGPEDLRGYFFAGMLEVAVPTVRIIDGGELYQYRDQNEFARSRDWRRFTMPDVATRVVPRSLVSKWKKRVKISYGLYDLQWKPNYPMTPNLLRQVVANAQRCATAPIWLFSEASADDHDYLKPGGVKPEWLAAVRGALADAQSGRCE